MLDELNADVQSILDTQWNQRTGKTVPDTSNVALRGGAVDLDGTFLYADLADSSRMARDVDRRVVAKIIKAFLATTARLVRGHDGTIVSFDGDRILGVFAGTMKNTNAATCALKINYVVSELIRPRFERKYPSIVQAGIHITHATGIDTGDTLAVRAGARGDNDLVWIGRAPNLAAKLSDLREKHFKTYVTATVYNKLNDSARYGGTENRSMWESATWTFLDKPISIYRSKWTWKP